MSLNESLMLDLVDKLLDIGLTYEERKSLAVQIDYLRVAKIAAEEQIAIQVPALLEELGKAHAEAARIGVVVATRDMAEAMGKMKVDLENSCRASIQKLYGGTDEDPDAWLIHIMDEAANNIFESTGAQHFVSYRLGRGTDRENSIVVQRVNGLTPVDKWKEFEGKLDTLMKSCAAVILTDGKEVESIDALKATMESMGWAV
jgi:hypothetical protein